MSFSDVASLGLYEYFFYDAVRVVHSPQHEVDRLISRICYRLIVILSSVPMKCCEREGERKQQTNSLLCCAIDT